MFLYGVWLFFGHGTCVSSELNWKQLVCNHFFQKYYFRGLWLFSFFVSVELYSLMMMFTQLYAFCECYTSFFVKTWTFFPIFILFLVVCIYESHVNWVVQICSIKLWNSHFLCIMWLLLCSFGDKFLLYIWVFFWDNFSDLFSLLIGFFSRCRTCLG